jgi:hypothetical protein
MYSIVPGGNVFSATAGTAVVPTKNAKIGKFEKHHGRRLVTSAPNGQQQNQQYHLHTQSQSEKSQAKSKIALGNASIEEIDKILEDDALALLNIKKEISSAQAEELLKIHDALLVTKREFDGVVVQNSTKERELDALRIQWQSLVGVDRATNITQKEAKSVMRDLTDQTAQVLDDLAAEQRTIKMQTLMIKRLDEEIGKCRVDASKAMINVETAQHDLQLAENSMHVNRQYLLEQETQLEKLQQTLRQRKDQRDGKINMLHNLSVESEVPIARLQMSLMESSRRSSPTRQIRANTANPTTRPIPEEEEEEDLNVLPELSARARRMTVNQIKEAIQRYQTQAARVERLQQQEAELKAGVSMQQKKKQELTEHLNQTQLKIQQLASSRQIYQEVDLKDHALAAASKEYEEAKDRDFRLKLHIESLKQSIPRFLTKITKTHHKNPNENLLADACLKLEDEVTKLIKIIASALLKDATPDDLAIMSQQAGSASDANSEFARLQRLPGFQRMQKQLFLNMMTARQDLSGQNVRVEQQKKNSDTISPRVRMANMKLIQKSSDDFEEDKNNGLPDLETGEDSALGRDTIKNISRLIVDRDAPKVRAVMEKSGR